MQRFGWEYLGSHLDILIDSDKDMTEVVSQIFVTVSDFEAKYSRFIPGNILAQINSNKGGELPKDILSLIQLSKKVSWLTSGNFDITVLPILENNGYGIAQQKQEENIGYENIKCVGDIIHLENNVRIEFGSFGKGYMIDVICNILKTHTSGFMINFWGDIYVDGERKIYLEDPIDTEKSIGSIQLSDRAIAVSAGNKRKLHTGSHLIQPKGEDTQGDILIIYVSHRLAVFADIFATALYVTPIEQAKRILEKTPDLEALIITRDGKMYKSKWFTCILNA